MKNILKEKNGITLIVLVITIIVLLILAGVSIMTLAGDNGLLKRTEISRDQTIISMEKEQISLAYNSCRIDNLFAQEVTAEQLENELINNGNDTTVTKESTKLIVKFNNTQNIYTIDENGKIEIISETQEDKEKAQINNRLIDQENISYADSLNTLLNPDRGFYSATYISIKDTTDNFFTDMDSVCSDAIRDQKKTLHLRFNIGQLSGNVNSSGVDREFTSEQLAELNAIFSKIRDYNLNAIVRFAYDYSGNTNKEPKSFDTIENHISQLSTVFQTNKDVITCVEAGFIGPWGEMHDGGDYQQDSYYKKLIEDLLANTPTSMTINVRKPYFYKLVLGSFNNSSNNKLRVGIFNDGYLGSASDLGTFGSDTSREEFINWMKTQGKYTYYGGEATKFATTSSSYNSEDEVWSDSEYALSEMPNTHTTYLNGKFNSSILTDKWKSQNYNNASSEYDNQTAYKYIEDHLGYRLVLRNSKISETVKQGEICGTKLKIENVGFGNIIRNQIVSVILSNGTKYYKAKLDIDAKSFESGATSDVDFYYYIPSSIDTGDWNVYLKIESAYNSNYAIKFANENIWNSNLDANLIGKVTVTENSEAKQTNIKQAFENDPEDGSEGTVTEKPEIVLAPAKVLFRFEYYLSGASPSQMVKSTAVYIPLGTTIDFTDANDLATYGLEMPTGYSYKFAQCPDLKGDWGGYSSLTIPSDSTAESYYAQVHVTKDNSVQLNFYYYDKTVSPAQQVALKKIFVEKGTSIDLTDQSVLSSLGLTLPEGYVYSHAECYDLYGDWSHHDVIEIPDNPTKTAYGIQIHMLK